MLFMPFNILGMWLRGLLSVAILAGAIYLLVRWYDDSHVDERPVAPVAAADPDPGRGQGQGQGQDRGRVEVAPARRVFRFDPGWNRPTAALAAALGLLAWATLGRLIGQPLLWLRSGKPRPAAEGAGPVADEGDEDPSADRTGAEVHTIARPNGTVLRVECYGPADGPPIVWTHGWGATGAEWSYQKRHLADRFRLIVWDEPGLGLSRKPDDNDYRMETMAADLDAVLALAGGRPAILVGHSIGGMITLTFCKQFPEKLGTSVAGLVLAHTTYTNPVRTTSMAGLYSALEKPVVIPLLYLTIATWPLAWLLNGLSYLNGSAHRSTHKSSFSGHETRGQLDFVARFMPAARPDVLARGMLGMIAYDASAVLPRINVPTLVFVGDQDTTTLPEAGRAIVEGVPGARLVTLAPAKHMGLVEHHEPFDRAVRAFAESCQPSEIGGRG